MSNVLFNDIVSLYGYDVSIEIRHAYLDMTVFGDPSKTYAAGPVRYDLTISKPGEEHRFHGNSLEAVEAWALQVVLR